jgi:hypothetical protein
MATADPVASAALAYGILLRGETVEVTAFAEHSGTLLDGVTFLVFGAVLLGPTLEHLTWQILVYAGTQPHRGTHRAGGALATRNAGAHADRGPARLVGPRGLATSCSP